MFQSLGVSGAAEEMGNILDARAEGEFGFATRLDQSGSYYNTEVYEAYLATSRELSPAVRIAVGRKREEWSKLDDAWQLGIWQPRYRWDALAPASVGLAGLFIQVDQPFFKLSLHASPGFIPERGAPLELREDGEFVSHSPFSRTPPSSIRLMGEETRFRYRIEMPSYADLLLQSGVSARARFGRKTGPWIAMGYAYKPMNQVLLSFETEQVYNLSTDRVEVALHPRVLKHHLVSLEAGHEHKQVSTWASLLEDRPQTEPSQPASRISQQVAPSRAFALGAELRPAKIGVSYLRQFGGNAPDSGKDANPKASLFEARYPFQSAIALTGREELGRGFSLSSRILYDLGHEGVMVGGKLAYRIQRSWQAMLSGDLLVSSAAPGSRDFISTYRGNDRIRAGVSYAF